MLTYEDIQMKLKKNNGRMTKSRVNMAELFLDNAHYHFTIEEIINALKKYEEVNVATVYNNLAAFVETDILIEFVFNGKKHYELNHGIHAHFVCLKCDKITNVDVPALSCIAMEIERKTGNVVSSNNIEFFGCCKECNEIYDCQSCFTNDNCKNKVEGKENG